MRKSKEYVSLRCSKSCFAGGMVQVAEKEQPKNYFDDELSRVEK